MSIVKCVVGMMLASGMIFGQGSLALAGHTRDVNVVACSADGKMIASGGEDEKTFLWDAAAHQEIASPGGGGAVMSVSISPDGKRIASGERYHKVNLLDASGKVVKVLEGHDAAVIATGFTADSQTVLTFSLDGGLRMWDAATGAAKGAVKTPLDSYSAGAFSADGRWFAGGTSGGNLYLYNVANKKAGIKLEFGTMVRAVAFAPDGKTLAAALGETVRIYSLADGKEVGSVAGAESNGLAFSTDGAKIAAAGHDNDVRVIDVAGLKTIATLKGHGRTVRSVCFMPDSGVVSGSFDMTVRIWPAQ